MGEGKRLFKNTLLIAISGVSTKVITFLLLPLYTSVLTTSEYGDYDYITILGIFLMPVVTLLLDESMFRFLIGCKSTLEKQRVFTIAVIIELCGVLLFSILAMIITGLIEYKYDSWLILYVVACSFAYIINPLLRGQGNYKAYAIYNMMISLSVTIFSIALILFWKQSIYSLLLACILGHVLAATIMSVYIKIWKYINIKSFSTSEAYKMLKYSLPLIPNKLSWAIISVSDRFIIMNLIGSNAAGIYAISNKFPMVMDTVYGFFSTAWQESASRVLDSENHEFYKCMYIYMQRFILSMCCIWCIFMPFLFSLLINEDYNEALRYIPILLVASAFGEWSVFFSGIFYAYKDTVTIGRSSVIAATLKIFFACIFIYKFGLYGGAVSTVISNVILYLYRKKAIKRYTNLKDDFKTVAISSIVFLCNCYCIIYADNVILTVACCLNIIYFSLINKSLIKIVLSSFFQKYGGRN